MTVLNFGAQPAPGVNALIFCNGCGAVSIDTPAFDWKRYRHKDICHHCPSCQEYNYLASMGLVNDRTAVVYEDWKVTAP